MFKQGFKYGFGICAGAATFGALAALVSRTFDYVKEHYNINVEKKEDTE